MLRIEDYEANTLGRVAGCFEDANATVAEEDLVSVAKGLMRKLRSGRGSHTNLCAGALRKLAVSGNKISVKMRFEDVFDRDVLLRGSVEVDLDITLRIDDECLALGGEQVGSVREACEEELFELHGYPPGARG